MSNAWIAYRSYAVTKIVHGHLLRADLLHDIEPVLLGHLHIEKDEIGFQLTYRVHRRLAVGRLADHLHPVLVSHQIVNAKPAELLVVDDENANGRKRRDRRRLGEISVRHSSIRIPPRAAPRDRALPADAPRPR